MRKVHVYTRETERSEKQKEELPWDNILDLGHMTVEHAWKIIRMKVMI